MATAKRKGATQYRALIDVLAASDQAEVVLTLTEIEQIIGKPLSDSAYTLGHIWKSPNLGYVQQWRALGWQAKLVRANGNPYVIFTHDIEP